MGNIPTTGGETCGCTTEETLIVWELDDSVESVEAFFIFLSDPWSSLCFLFLILTSAIFNSVRGCCGIPRMKLSSRGESVCSQTLCQILTVSRVLKCPGSSKLFILPPHRLPKALAGGVSTFHIYVHSS